MTTTSTSTTPHGPDGAAPLRHWGVIQAQGDDAATFLHSQLSQDIQSLAAGQARLGAFCTAKGRMLASFVIICPQPGHYWLACNTEVLPATLKRLSMFVLRAKAKLADASNEIGLVGLVGPTARRLLGDTLLPSAWSSTACQGGVLVRLPDSRIDNATHTARYLWAGPSAQADAITAGNPALPIETWKWLEVTSGVATIVGATVEQFVPQMVNFELVGGVNFKKGCYPGQEIVARSQYLGKLKRRAVLTHANDTVAAGQEVFSAEDPGQPCGMVVNATAAPSGGYAALVETKLAALAGSGLHVGAADGPVLQVLDLPYALPDDAVQPA